MVVQKIAFCRESDERAMLGGVDTIEDFAVLVLLLFGSLSLGAIVLIY